MDRRNFLKNMARGSILVGLGIITGKLLFEEKTADFCEYHFICSKCKQLSACKLPEADKFKEINQLNRHIQ